MALGRAMPTVVALDRCENEDINKTAHNGLESAHDQHLQGQLQMSEILSIRAEH